MRAFCHHSRAGRGYGGIFFVRKTLPQDIPAVSMHLAGGCTAAWSQGQHLTHGLHISLHHHLGVEYSKRRAPTDLNLNLYNY